MRACPGCFRSNTWVSNAPPAEAEAGYCDFCARTAEQTWPTTTWTESLVRLLDIYEVVHEPDSSLSELHVQVQNDWQIFDYENLENIRTFLMDALPTDNPLLQAGKQVRLRYEASGPKADHTISWRSFSEEIRFRNRYFPQTEPDLELLRHAIEGSVVSVSQGTVLFRARRIQDGGPFSTEEMGAPPIEGAVGGRANPVGIPYLYLSCDDSTCIYETRVANHTEICVGSFRTVHELKILDLANISHPDFFSVDNPIAGIAVFNYMKRLGDELKKPVRSSDQPIDYIPTQYLCELAKSFGIDGVQYSSSLNPSGRNIVLFDVEAAQCEPPVRVAKITGLTASWDYVNIAQSS